MPVKNIFIALLICAVVPGCKKNTVENDREPLARVYDKYLYTAEVEGLINENTSAEDSARIINEYIDNWIRQNLILKVAEDNLQSTVAEINKHFLRIAD